MRRNPQLDRKIGAALRALRKRRSLSDADVAERMGNGPNGKHYVNRWERGDRGITAGRLWHYLQAIDATLSDLDRELGARSSTNRRLEEIARELQLLSEDRS